MKRYPSREDDVQAGLENVIKRLRQMKAQAFDAEKSGKAVVHNSTDFEEVLNMVRQVKNPIGFDI